MTNGHMTLVTLHSDGHGLLGTLQVSIGPNTEGDELGIELRNVLKIKIYA
jgi:hypothetical protein